MKLIRFGIVTSILVALAFFLPWSKINWGKFELFPSSTIEVTGNSESQMKSEIATYFVSATAFDPDKQVAISQVNEKMSEVVAKIKEFGIPDEDIQTQNVSAYEEGDVEILLYPPREIKKGWRATNSLSAKLRNAELAPGFTDLLNAIRGVEYSGPSFSLDDTSEAETELLAEAVENARTKAQKIAEASGRKLGKVVSVRETDYYSGPVSLSLEDSSRGAPIEVGTETIYKSVVVVFELK